MRVAIFSDVHGNVTAFDAVFADAQAAGVDEFWVVGDLVAHGPCPAETIGRLRELPSARCVRGNTDRYVLNGELPEIVRTGDTELVIAATTSFAWTRGAITAVGAYDWLDSLPLEQRVTLPDGTHVLLVHASPGTDDGAGIHDAMTDQDLVDCGVTAAGADLIFVGHTHVPLDRCVSGVRIVNLGSVSLPATTERRAMWTLLTTDENGYTVERRFSPYDMDAVCAALDGVHHPSADWLRAKFRSQPD